MEGSNSSAMKKRIIQDQPFMKVYKKVPTNETLFYKCPIHRYLVTFTLFLYLFYIDKQLSICFLAGDISISILNNHFNHCTFCYDICCCPVTDIMSIFHFHHWQFCYMLQTTC